MSSVDQIKKPKKKKSIKQQSNIPDNVNARFDAIYNIVKNSWNQGELVQNAEESIEYDTDKETRRFIKKLAKKHVKENEIPNEAPAGLSFCLAGAAMYVGGPTEEEITGSLAVAATLMTYSQDHSFESIKNEITRDIYDFDDVFDIHVHEDDVDLSTLIINGKYKLLRECTETDLFVKLYKVACDNRKNDNLIGYIYSYNDDSGYKEEVLNLIKIAKKVYKVANELDITKKTYTPYKLYKRIGIK